MDGPLEGRKVGERLFEWLEYTGETTSELAQAEGMSRTTVSSLLNGRIERPHLNTVRKLARHFGVSVEEFLEGTAPKVPSGAQAELPDAKQMLQDAGYSIDRPMLPDDDWWDSYKDPVLRGRDAQDQWVALQPRLLANIEIDEHLYPDTPHSRLPSRRLYADLWRRYWNAYKVARKALEDTDDPTDGGRFPPPQTLGTPEPMSGDETRYVIWEEVEPPELVASATSP